MITGVGARGDTSAEEDDRDVALASDVEEIRPNFRFQNDDDGRFDAIHDGLNAESPIEREIVDGVGEGKTCWRGPDR